jgi:hypothetical protein
MYTGGRQPQTVMGPLHAVGQPGQLQVHLQDPALGPLRPPPPTVTDKQLPLATICSSCLVPLSSFYRYQTCLVPVKPFVCVLYWVLAVCHRPFACSVLALLLLNGWTLLPLAGDHVSVLSMYGFWSIRHPFSIDFVWKQDLWFDPTLKCY